MHAFVALIVIALVAVFVTAAIAASGPRATRSGPRPQPAVVRERPRLGAAADCLIDFGTEVSELEVRLDLARTWIDANEGDQAERARLLATCDAIRARMTRLLGECLAVVRYAADHPTVVDHPLPEPLYTAYQAAIHSYLFVQATLVKLERTIKAREAQPDCARTSRRRVSAM